MLFNDIMKALTVIFQTFDIIFSSWYNVNIKKGTLCKLPSINIYKGGK